MEQITVVTSITGGKDTLRNDQERGNAKYVAFMDVPQRTDLWEIRPAYDKFKDPRRNSRIHKILIHKFVESKYTIWIDGNIKMINPPEEIIETYMKGYDMAIFKHPNRDCIYDEALICAKLKLDDPELIIEQAKWYEDHEYAKHKGLCEGGVIIRKNTQKVRDFNEAWWADYCRFSRRDQLSLFPALDKVGINVNYIDECFQLGEHNGEIVWKRGKMFLIDGHLNDEGNMIKLAK
jgi:hypothetical protein